MILNIRNGRNTSYGLQIQKYVPEKNKKIKVYNINFLNMLFYILARNHYLGLSFM